MGWLSATVEDGMFSRATEGSVMVIYSFSWWQEDLRHRSVTGSLRRAAVSQQTDSNRLPLSCIGSDDEERKRWLAGLDDLPPDHLSMPG